MESQADNHLSQSMLGLSLQGSPPRRETTLSPSPSSLQGDVSALTAPLSTTPLLLEVLRTGRLGSSTVERKCRFIRDVLFLVNRTSSPLAVSAELQTGPLIIDDQDLAELLEAAVELLLEVVSTIPPAGTKLAPPIAEAIYHWACLTSTGAFPSRLPENPRTAFRAFETSARAGYSASWFKLGRNYEAFDDSRRAKDCFERGAKAEDVSCLYRLGMAYLMGQLGLTESPSTAVQLLYRAAEKATVVVPQPAYVYASLLLGDFAHASANLPASIFQPHTPSGSTIEEEAQRFLERAAYLHFTPAQYKLGHFYEFARAPYAYDPLLSVQYYTLASESDPEANLALSKWFLCGAEGFFEKDELLARTFAERAARAGLPSAEFAVGYYWEVGIGSVKDMRRAKRWYEKAAAHGNSDAVDRLTFLAQNATSSLSRQDHDQLAEQTLVRRRTQAKQCSDAAGSVRRGGPQKDAGQVVELVRRASKVQPKALRGKRAGMGSGAGSVDNHAAPSRNSSGGRLSEIEEFPKRDAFSEGTAASSALTLAPPNQLFPERKRYSLVDSGPSSRSGSPQPIIGADNNNVGTRARSGTPPRRYPSPSPAWTSRTEFEVGSSILSTAFSESPIPSPGLDAGPMGSAAPNAPRVKYNTFAEMGIQASKVEEKDCVIM
ncbi:HCP-like protein [Fomitiporia mediterranea MF3/22]|uniref:HCP-like protein n=1 Tax=Fomitiporia mediterranea (strain MF3/22) TaxID=694068 RepID=UPI0004409BE0|nr:HCP-like protein [Fomitiporia mediterranea MF3/22]EJC99101.1 HCP-like protein [Fomitiporia mediterranea MF3/22]